MLDNYQDLIQELTGMPSELKSLLGEPVAPDLSPTVLGLLVELRDRDQAVLDRLQTMLRERNPYVRALKPVVDPAIQAKKESDPQSVVTAFNVTRGDLISLLMNLTLRDWEQTATHEIDGEITLAEEVERHVEFDEDQLARIQDAVQVEGS